jgi:tetratricopeptide (TPR) repeat protein
VDSRTRHELKQDEFRDGLERAEVYIKEHVQQIITVSIIAILVVGLVGGLKYYTDRQEANANADLGEALTTFRAYVGAPTPGQSDPNAPTYATAQDKYKKALQQFDAIVDKYHTPPRPKAVEVALYQAGICQSLLGDNAGAIRTLTQASDASDKQIASLSKFALAGELVKSGKTADAVKLYQELADHPTLSVPKAGSLLAMADAYRASQPAQARQLYQRVQSEFSSDPTVAQAVKQQMSTLNP